MSSHLKETLLESVAVIRGKFMQVLRDTVKLPDGAHATREYIKHPGGVAIIALTIDNKLVLEYQYRHPVEQIMLEIPAGKVDHQEDTLLAAKRELKEETGYTSDDWVELGHCFPSIGYSSEKIVFYLAKNCQDGVANLDEGEFIDILTMSIDECLNLAYQGKITDGKTLSGLMLFEGYRLNQIRSRVAP